MTISLNFPRSIRNPAFTGRNPLRSTLIYATLCSWLATGPVVANEKTVGDVKSVVVRVQKTPGGPQIHVDGKTMPPRFFFALPYGIRPMMVGETWSNQSFEFTPDAAGNGRLQFHFGRSEGQVWLSDIRITDMKTGKDILSTCPLATKEDFPKGWQMFPASEANTVGKIAMDDNALQITLKRPKPDAQFRDWPNFYVARHKSLPLVKDRTYRCTFRAKATKGQFVRPDVYRSNNRIGGAPMTMPSQVALARDAGVRLITFCTSARWDPPEAEPNWAPLDDICRKILAVNPHALLVPRFDADAPAWWLERHPDARMVYDEEMKITKVCVSDRAYRADAAAHFEKLARHLCEAFPENFAGLQPCGQNTGEWFYEHAFMPQFSGYDPATRKAFRQWLKQRGDPAADTAEVPTRGERRNNADGLLHDPVKNRRVVEFNLFLQEEMADTVLAIARACRRGSDGKKLVIFFYGYGFELSRWINGAAISGHYALEKVLREGRDSIDILCGPYSYWDRSWNGTGPVMSAAESVNRAGILWLNETDVRTHPFIPRSGLEQGLTKDLKQTQYVLLRSTAQAALRGFGTWWMDLFGDGWYDDPAIWQVMKQLQPMDEAMLRRQSPFAPEIAAILDEDSMCCLTTGAAVVTTPLIYRGRTAFGRCGAPYGQYLLQDVVEGNVPARMWVFLSAWRLTPQQREALAAQRKTSGEKNAPGAVRVWCWAPGYLYPDRADINGIEELTGFKAKAVSPPTAVVTPTQLGCSKGLAKSWGPKRPIRPLFSVEAAEDEVLATYADGSPAVTMRCSKTGLDVFVGTPELTPELLHVVAKAAGVHLFTKPGPTLWAAEGYLLMQSDENGTLSLDTERKQPVFDALNGERLGDGPRVELNMEQGEVQVLRIE